MNLDLKYLPKSDEVFSVMFKNKKLCEEVLYVILGERIELTDAIPQSQSKEKAADSSVFFDIKTFAKDGRIITLDMQRKFRKDRVRKRTVYYACKEISTQTVIKGQYEDLKGVIVNFLLTEANLKDTTDNSTILLKNDSTGELYTDLLSIHEVNIRHISDNDKPEMVILRDFFQMENQNDYDKFVDLHSSTFLGKLLIEEYQAAVSQPSILDSLSKEERIMYRLSEEERIEAEEKGLQEGEKKKAIEIAKTMIADKEPIEKIIRYTGLTEVEIKSL